MSLRVPDYLYPDSATPAEAFLWPENVMFGSSDQSGRVVLWVHRSAADAIAAVTPGSRVHPADVVPLAVDLPGTPEAERKLATVEELVTMAGGRLVELLCVGQPAEIQAAVVRAATANPPNVMAAISDALYHYLTLRRYPGSDRVQDA